MNYIRKECPSVEQVKSLTGKALLFTSDEYLIPVISEDPYLQLGSGEWSDEEEDGSGTAQTDPDKEKLLRRLTKKLEEAKRVLADFRDLVEKKFKASEIAEAAAEDVRPCSLAQKRRRLSLLCQLR